MSGSFFWAGQSETVSQRSLVVYMHQCASWTAGAPVERKLELCDPIGLEDFRGNPNDVPGAECRHKFRPRQSWSSQIEAPLKPPLTRHPREPGNVARINHLDVVRTVAGRQHLSALRRAPHPIGESVIGIVRACHDLRT